MRFRIIHVVLLYYTRVRLTCSTYTAAAGLVGSSIQSDDRRRAAQNPRWRPRSPSRPGAACLRVPTRVTKQVGDRRRNGLARSSRPFVRPTARISFTRRPELGFRPVLSDVVKEREKKIKRQR